MLRQETGPPRRAMQALLKGRLVFTSQEHDAERFFTFDGEGSISPVISGIAGLQRGVVAPTGFATFCNAAGPRGRPPPGGLRLPYPLRVRNPGGFRWFHEFVEL
jgi:hypothetical protein